MQFRTQSLWGLSLLIAGLGVVPARGVESCSELAKQVCCGQAEAESLQYVPLCPTASNCKAVHSRHTTQQHLSCCGKDYQAMVCLSCELMVCEKPDLKLCRYPNFVLKSEGQLAQRCNEVAQEVRDGNGTGDTLIHEDLGTAQLPQ